MKIEIFSVPADGGAAAVGPLNAFLSRHRVLTVEKALVSGVQGGAFWSFVVTYLDGPPPPATPSGGGASPVARDALDYRKELPPETFALFSRLRDVRKRIANEEGVPVYMVLTNAQMAEMARARCANKAEMGRIEGVGAARLDKYAERFLAEIAAHEKNRRVDGADRGTGESAPGVLESRAPQTPKG